MITVISVAASFLWVILLKRLESPAKNHRKPISAVPYIFLYGLLSIPAVIFLYDFSGFAYVLIARLPSLLYNIMFIGLFEELSKFAVFYIFALNSDFIKEPEDGLLYGAVVALGFAVLENVKYAYRFGIGNLLYRSINGPIAHMSLAALWGYAAGLYICSRRAGRNEYKLGMLAGAVFSAAVLHGVYNFLIYSGWGGVAKVIIVLLSVLSVSVYRYSRKSAPAAAAAPAKTGKVAKSFLLNKKAALICIKSGRYKAAAEYLRIALRFRPGNLQARIYLLLLKLLNDDLDDYAVFREFEKLCGDISISMLLRLKQRVSGIFSRCPYKNNLLEMFDDLILSNKETAVLKQRTEVFERAAAAGAVNGQGGFRVLERCSLPMAYRLPAFYPNEE